MIECLKWDRKPITAPGWYDGIPLSVYHSAGITTEPSVSSSGLRKLWAKSPKHFFATWPHNVGRDEDDEESKAFVLGRAAHHLFLGEDNFALEFIVRPEKIAGLKWHGNRLECQTFLKLQKAAGRTVLSPDDIIAIRGMARGLAGDEEGATDLLQGAVEQTLVARDPQTGIWLKARPDAIPTADGIYGDLKTTESVVDYDLKGSLRRFGYHMQGALLWEVCELLGLPFDGFALIFVEKKSPHCVRVIEVPDEDLALGRMQNRAMLRLMKTCLDAGKWPGPGRAKGQIFGLPKAEVEHIEVRLKEMDEMLAIAEAA